MLKLIEKVKNAMEASEAAEAMNAAKYPEAMHHYSQALKIAPDSLDAKMGYAEAERLLKQDGSDQKVTLLFRQAEKLTPKIQTFGNMVDGHAEQIVNLVLAHKSRHI